MAIDNSSPVQPLEGKTTIDDKMFFEPERLSYESACEIAAKILVSVKKAIENRTVVIAAEQMLTDLANLRGVYLTLDHLVKDYDSIARASSQLPKTRSLMDSASLETVTSALDMSLAAVASAIPVATAGLQAALGLMSLLREDVEYHGTQTQIDSLSFEIELASRVRKYATKVIVPDLFVLSQVSDDGNSLAFRLNEVRKAKTRAWQVVGPLVAELVRLEAELDRVEKEHNQDRFDELSNQISALRRDLHPLSDPLSIADRTIAEMETGWHEPGKNGGPSLLARLLRAEAIHRMPNLIYLHAKVVSSGGHHRISRSLFRTLFLGDGLSFAGGAIARWAILNSDGSVEDGGVLVARRSEKFALTIS